MDLMSLEWLEWLDLCISVDWQKNLYTCQFFSPYSDIIDHEMALHMMFQLITFGLGGETFNVIGHQDWSKYLK